MKIFALFFASLFFTLTTFAAPKTVELNGNYVYITYLGSSNEVDVYATDTSLQKLKTDINYFNNGIWWLDIIYSFGENEELRKKIIESLSKDKITVWNNTQSGNRKFWAIYSEMWYRPEDETLHINLNESFFNINGELLGKSKRNSPDSFETNKLSEHPKIGALANVVSKYVYEHYPIKQKIQANLE